MASAPRPRKRSPLSGNFQIVPAAPHLVRLVFSDPRGSEIFHCICGSRTFGFYEAAALKRIIARNDFARHLSRDGTTYFLLVTAGPPPLMARSIDFASVEERERAISMVRECAVAAPVDLHAQEGRPRWIESDIEPGPGW